MQDPVKQSYFVLFFEQPAFTDPLAFTNWPDDVSIDPPSLCFINNATVTASATPTLEVKLPTNSGTLDDKDLEIVVPFGVNDIFDDMVAGYAIPPTNVVVQEVQIPVGPVDNGDVVVTHGRWRVSRAILNPEGRIGIIRIEAKSLKGRLMGIPLGIPATPRCAWTLGDKTCGIDVGGTSVTCLVAAVSGKTLTLTDPTDTAVVNGVTDKRWHRGTFRKDGLVIGIRDFTIGNYTFQLVKEAPPSWVGQNVTIRAGCDKTAETCDARFSNIANFGGFGIAIPAYHPVLDAPQ